MEVAHNVPAIPASAGMTGVVGDLLLRGLCAFATTRVYRRIGWPAGDLFRPRSGLIFPRALVERHEMFEHSYMKREGKLAAVHVITPPSDFCL